MDQLIFAVFAVGGTWATYADAKGAAASFRDALNAVHGDYTYISEYFGGNPEPDETQCAVPFMDPSDRAIAEPPAGTALLTELEWANDPGWQPPIGAVMAEPQAAQAKAAEHTTLGKKIRKHSKKK